jgi:hypothetical protein
MARGLGRLSAMRCQAAPVRPASIDSMGDPWDTNSAGMRDMVDFLQ